MSNNVPGLVKPTQIGMIGSTPKDSAMMSLNNMNQKQASLSNAVGGKRLRKKYGGATDSTSSGITVPQYNMPYQPQNGPGQDPNSQIVQNSVNSTQGAANAVYDNEATKLTGGKKIRKSKKHKQRKSRKSRKSRKHKHRKTVRK